MINELKNIISKSATVYSGSLDRFYYNYVPQNTSLPYATYFLINETYNGKDSLNLYGDVRLQFNIYSDYKDYGNQCHSLSTEIMNYFDNDFRTYANTSGSLNIISCNRDYYRPATFINDVWQSTIQFSIHVLN
jgi:hypothetical protein